MKYDILINQDKLCDLLEVLGIPPNPKPRIHSKYIRDYISNTELSDEEIVILKLKFSPDEIHLRYPPHRHIATY